MKKGYKASVNIPEDGYDIPLYTKSLNVISKGYERVVFGGRGPYIEFTEKQIELGSFIIPKDQLYRLTDLRIYYIEFRSNDASNVKLYYQLKTVAYADYKIGYFYISPYDLYTYEGLPCIKKFGDVQEASKAFFEL
jgi:hypothetical protein